MNINEFIFKLDNPQVYTGREINAAGKDISGNKNFINVCLVFPDKYEIGMSHYGLIILYHILNNMTHIPVNAERCFLPGKPSIEKFKKHNVPLFSLENKIPLKHFDLIGFSLLSEMNYTNVLQILDLAGIPFHTRERDGRFPVIAAGGISAVNPEPLREFIDVFGIGDGEEIFPDIIDVLAEARQKQRDRKSLFRRLDKVESLYVPSLYPPVKKGRFYLPEPETGAIKKRALENFEHSFDEDRLIVPITDVVFNRLTVEIARGCPQNCRFCQAKSYYAPYRFRSPGKNTGHIINGLKATGFESFSLSTLSTGDYPYLNELLPLIPEIITRGVSFSLSSLRPSTLSDRLLSTIARFKRTGITIVPEAGTQRLRNVINKDVTDEEIFHALELALRNKWQKIKVYFMLGLPTETMEDIDGIVELIRKMFDTARAAKQKIKIHASFSSFVPKPQTPLQWAKRENLEELFKKMRYIKKQLKHIKARYLDLDFHNPQNGVVETVLARGDYRVGELLLKAFAGGEVFSAWDMDFHYSSWAGLIDHSYYETFLEELSPDEPLPWDFLQVNFKKDYLKQEYRKALSAVPTPPCDREKCKNCKGCIYGMKQDIPPPPLDEKPGVEGADKKKNDITYNRVRIFYEKTGDFVFFSQLSIMKYIERLIRKTGIAFKCSEGFTPRIKITSLPPLPVFAAGLNEVVELFLDASFKENDILEILNRDTAAGGFKFKKVIECNHARPLSRDIHYLGFEIIVENLPGIIDEIVRHLGETDFASYSNDRLILKMDYSKQGQERFARIYKIIDPGKKRTRYLTRTQVTFRG